MVTSYNTGMGILHDLRLYYFDNCTSYHRYEQYYQRYRHLHHYQYYLLSTESHDMVKCKHDQRDGSDQMVANRAICTLLVHEELHQF